MGFVGKLNERHLVSCGSDAAISIRSIAALDQEPSTTYTKEAVSMLCMAASPTGSCFAIGDQQSYVKMYSFPGAEFQSIITRTSQPVRALAFSPSGGTLAVAGDDGNIKVVDTAANKVLCTLVSGSYIRSLAYDPQSQLLASVSADGCLRVWEIAERKLLHTLRGAAPRIEAAQTLIRQTAAWQPMQGVLLAVPAPEGAISLYDRHSWKIVGSLTGSHTQHVNTLAFSSDGMHLASAGRDRMLTVWNVRQRKQIASKRVDSLISDLAWEPRAARLMAIGEEGAVYDWQHAVPAGLMERSSPLDELADCLGDDDLNGAEKGSPLKRTYSFDIGESPTKLQKRAGLIDDAAEDDDADDDKAVSMAADDFDDAGSLGDFIDNDDGSLNGRPGSGGRNPTRVRRPASASAQPKGVQPQEAIQPGSTPAGQDSRRRWLAYDGRGAISSRADEGFHVVECTLHDTSISRKRPPLLNDFFGFSLAALGDKGPFYASKASRDAPSMLVYRPPESWAPNADWTVSLPAGEDAVAVAAGRSFCAVATSRHLLRLFSLAGLQIGVLSMEGPAVALTARGHSLALVWHSAHPQGKQQHLSAAVWDLAEQTQVAAGRLPLAPGSVLTWLGFTDAGALAAYDSEGVMRVRTPDYGGTWAPVFDSAATRAERESTSEVYWPVSLSSAEMVVIVCSTTRPFPSVVPPPVLSTLPLRVPTVGGETGGGDAAESDMLLLGLQLSCVRACAQADEAAAADAEQAEKELDGALLKLYHAALKTNRLPRALGIAGRMGIAHSLEGALKLANHYRVPALADKISTLLQSRLELEAAELEASPEPEASPVRSLPHERYERPLPGRRSASADAEASDVDDDNARDTAQPPPAKSKPKKSDSSAPLRSRTNTVLDSSPQAGTKRKAGSANPFARSSRPRA